ncbi:MFS transporter [uncultured Gilvimarinus sp.]|uniref:MFS transporter n=1 Tax=uncultured Gilvimarinus sp. TaxID=1689143 RepID=UPI0030EB58B6
MSEPTASFERRVVMALSSLYAFRMLGLFMVLPVLTLYGDAYSGATPALLGLALGAYGFSQALLQIPFGMLSDRIGRKPVIVGGLLIFVLGSVVAAQADTVYELVLGRILQGGGAIASAVMAMVTDLTADENRTKAMASIGASIGVSFALALVIGPALAGIGGLGLIFWVTAALGLVGVYIIIYQVPAVSHGASAARRRETGAVPALLAKTLRNPELLRLDVGIFALHCVLTASFVVLPGVLASSLGVARAHHWVIYLPLLVGSFIAMLPFIIIAEKRRKMKRVFLAAIGLLAGALLWLVVTPQTLLWWLPGLFAFFMAFNLLEATLPSLVSKLAPAGSKGTATGIYSTAQFLGAFTGGVAGGALLQWQSAQFVLAAGAALVALWWLIARPMTPPRYLASMLLPLNGCDPAKVSDTLTQIDGVAEVVVVPDESMVYLKVDAQKVEREQILAAMASQ